ncbi:hypothetical protein GW916_04415 [bacterium]|nr:hypothetical protein [bacterium]
MTSSKNTKAKTTTEKSESGATSKATATKAGATATKAGATATLRVSVLKSQKEWVVSQSSTQGITQAEFVQNIIKQAQTKSSYADLPDLIADTIREEIKKLQKSLQENVFDSIQKAINKNVDEVVDGVHDVMTKGRGFVQKVSEKAASKAKSKH